ncbi:DUF484 family protein [Sulfuriflexus mobilis]|uniref:DUF484 family protein n=1 Tax=Sulfuriflexus mobilis TaxID=1811807 RepID=UPI000F831CA9|nr:DUF484 family protein [Sulfuriflexus mobilis]
MSSHQGKDLNIDGASEKDVAEFLQKHPRFFENNINLLAEMRLPHPSGTAVSLIERQVNILRDNNQKLEQKLNNLIQIARDNDKLNARIQKMALALMETTSLDEVFYAVQDSLRSEFLADSVVLRLFNSPEQASDVNDVAFITRDEMLEQLFSKFFRQKKPLCGALDEAQARFLFVDAATDIASAALVPVCDKECFGLLAIGSYDEQRFNPAMGTVFLSHIGDMVGRTLRPHL